LVGLYTPGGITTGGIPGGTFTGSTTTIAEHYKSNKTKLPR